MNAADGAVLATVLLAYALAVASPGPDFAMVVRRSLTFGRASGIWTAAGIGSGIMFHVGYALFGLSWLTTRWPPAVTAIGVVGGVFLTWMGLSALRARPLASEGDTAPAAPSGGAHRDFLVGLLTNLLNPKAVLFFVALFSAVLAGSDSGVVRAILAVFLPVATFSWFALVATMLSHAHVRRRLRAIAHWIDRAMGVLLLVLAAGLFLEAFR